MSKILIKSAWGSDDPTKAAFAFVHAKALADAGHEVHILLLGEAVYLMRSVTAESVVPVGWPSVADAMRQVIAQGIPLHVWTACAVSRGVTTQELDGKNASFSNPATFVSLVEWADKIITE